MLVLLVLLLLTLATVTADDIGVSSSTKHPHPHQHHRHRQSVASCLLEARLRPGVGPSNSTEGSDKSACRRTMAWPVSCLFAPIDHLDSTAAIQSCFRCCFAFHARRLAALRDALPRDDVGDATKKNVSTHHHGHSYGDDESSFTSLIGPMMHPLFSRDREGLPPFLAFLNSTSYVTVWIMTWKFDGHGGLGPLLHLLAQHRRPVLITITDVQLPRPSGKAYSPPDAATEKGLDGTVGHWFTTNPEVTAIRHPRVHDFPIGLKSGTTIRTFRERLDDLRSKKAAAAAAAAAVPSIDGAALLPAEKRPDLLMCCCMANSKKRRETNKQLLMENGFECLATGHKVTVPEDEYFERMSRAKFVYSPKGKGDVNFRDLESVFLGAIPLVDARVRDARWNPDDFPLELWNGTVYEELPVVRVTNWSAVTPRSLERIWAAVKGHRERKYQEEARQQLQHLQDGQQDRQHALRRRPLVHTGESGTMVGTDLRRAWTPYHLGRVIAALGHCRQNQHQDHGAADMDEMRGGIKSAPPAAAPPSPWWCDAGWRRRPATTPY